MPGIKYPGLLRFKWNKLNLNPCVMGPSLSRLIFLWTLVGKGAWAFHHYLGLSVSFYWISSVDCSHLSSLPSQVTLVVKNLPANAGDTRDTSLIPGSGRSSGEVNGNPLQYSCLENPMNRGAWQATVHGSQRVRHDWSDLSHTQTHTHTHTHTPPLPSLQMCNTAPLLWFPINSYKVSISAARVTEDWGYGERWLHHTL